MNPQKLIEQNADGTFLSINRDGEKLPLIENAHISFDNLAGSHVQLFFKTDTVKCRAKVPESGEEIRFRIDTGDYRRNNVTDLEAMIYRARVELNGRL